MTRSYLIMVHDDSDRMVHVEMDDQDFHSRYGMDQAARDKQVAERGLKEQHPLAWARVESGETRVSVQQVTPMTNAEYRDNFSCCPVCRQEGVQEADRLEPSDNRAYQNLVCGRCGFRFTDEYELAGYMGEDGCDPAGKPADKVERKLFLQVADGMTEPFLVAADDEADLLTKASEARDTYGDDSGYFWVEFAGQHSDSGWFSWDLAGQKGCVALELCGRKED